MKKVSTAVAQQRRDISQQRLIIGLDLRDHNSWYCLLELRSAEFFHTPWLFSEFCPAAITNWLQERSG